MKYIYSLFLIICLSLTSCKNEEYSCKDTASAQPEETSAAAHVSKADFEKYVPGKLWAHVDIEGKPLATSAYVNSAGEYEFSPWDDDLCFPRSAFIISGREFREFDREGNDWDLTNGPRMHSNTCAFNYDETTGMITCDARINIFNAHSASVYVESVSKNKIVLREHYGCLPVGYGGNLYEELNGELDPESYFRQEYYAVPEKEEAAWRRAYADLGKRQTPELADERKVCVTPRVQSMNHPKELRLTAAK